MNKFIQYIKESYLELRKVTWPTREQVTNYTIAVIVTSLIFAIFLGLLDFIFSKIIKQFIV